MELLLGAATILHSSKQANQGAYSYTFVLLHEKQRLWGTAYNVPS